MNKQPIDLSLLDGVLEEYASVKGSLITILQNTQDIYGYLPREAVDCRAYFRKNRNSYLRNYGRRYVLHTVPF